MAFSVVMVLEKLCLDRSLCAPLTMALATVFSTAPLSRAQAAPLSGSLTQISSDPFTVGPGQHATEVEPHMLANRLHSSGDLPNRTHPKRRWDCDRVGDFH